MSRPAGELRPPGIYMSLGEAFPKPIIPADTRVAGFVGLAVKGPLDEPVTVHSWDEFAETYGVGDVGYLARAVEGFFLNGGEACVVVRVAHAARGEDAIPGPDHAACAERVVRDSWDKRTLRVRARTEGRWGNQIWMRFSHAVGAKSLLARDLDMGMGEASLTSTRGLERGAMLRIYDRESADYVIITDVEGREIRWSANTPIHKQYKAASPTYLEVVEIELHAALRDRRETFKGLQLDASSRRYIGRLIKEESRLVIVEKIPTTTPLAHCLPKIDAAQKLIGGRDGIEKVTPEDFVGYDHGPGERAGAMALGAVDEVAMLACPDAMLFYNRNPGPQGEVATQRIQDVMLNMCENLKDRFAVLDLPPTRQLEAVARWRRRVDSSYCAFYWPWLGAVEGDGKVNYLPPSGHMAGLYARCDKDVGVHRAPANEPLRGIVDLSVPVTEDDQGLLNSEQINTFRANRGIRPWGARTASSDIDWRFINVRRLFIMLRRALEAGSGWVVFEPNTPNTWETLQNKVRSFLSKLFEKGMFAGGSPEESFYVKCDAETNPHAVTDAGMLVCEVGVAPAVPAEFIVIQVVQKLDETQQ